MIYDCFLFNDELDVLTIRLNELYTVVDRFVLVESTVSHSCKPKRLSFEENKERFKRFKDKIIHIIIKDTPDVNLTWIINDYQFSQLKRGLTKCMPSDIILFGDLDEIPKAEAVSRWKDRPGKLKIFEQVLCEYYLNFADMKKLWYGTRMTTYKNLQNYSSLWIAKYSKFDVIIPNGGWHFSYIADIKGIQRKLASMTHQEYNNSHYNTSVKILQAIRKGHDVTNNGFNFHIVNNNFLPKYVSEHKEKFSQFILKESQISSLSFILKLIYFNLWEILRKMKNKITTHNHAPH